MNRQARTALTALETLNELDGAAPTAEQRAALSAWTGWGGLAPALGLNPGDEWLPVAERLDALLSEAAFDVARDVCDTSFFTPDIVVDAVFALLRKTGFVSGRGFEPGCGAGAFLTRTPADMDITWTGVDMDPTAASIARVLNPEANIITGRLEKTSFPTGGFDFAVGNVPFSSAHIFDPAFPGGPLHTYFLNRALDAVRVGGYVIVVTSRYQLDAGGPIAAGADLVSAVRLPAGTFDGTGVVADILVLRKRSEFGPALGWVEPTHEERYYGQYGSSTRNVPTPHTVTTDDKTVTVSGHWGAHLDCVAGTMAATGFSRSPLTVKSEDRSADINRAVAAAAAFIRTEVQPVAGGFTELPPLEDTFGRKEGSFHFLDDTQKTVGQVQGGVLTAIRGTAELKALMPLRDAALRLIELESDPDLPDSDIAPERAAALALYEAYVTKYGAVNRSELSLGKPDAETGDPTFSWRRPPLGGFRRDPDSYAAFALENYDDDTSTASPAPILLRRVGGKVERPTSAASAGEAVAISRAEHGRLHIGRVAALLNIDVPAASVLLLEQGLAYRDPASKNGDLVLERDYLSGNVRVKLAAARTAAAGDDSYTGNVTALEAVMPADLGAEEIRAQLGSSWITGADISRFCEEVFGAHVTVLHTVALAHWEVSSSPWTRTDVEAALAFGTQDMTPFQLLEHGLNGKSPIVYDDEFTPNGVKKVKNQTKTLAAEEALKAIHARFSVWVWEDAERAARLITEYNRRFNSHVVRRNDGSYLDFPGMDPSINLWAHQRDGVDRVISSERAMVAHPVGAGKAQPMDSLILTPTGFRRMGDFMIGDEVTAPDGTTTSVTGVFPQGPMDNYRVSFTDGSTVECNDEHLWNVMSINMVRYPEAEWRTRTLRSLMEEGLKTPRGQDKWVVPLVEAADFDCGLDRPVDPYLLGLILGDGSVTAGSISFTTADVELADSFRDLIGPNLTLNHIGTPTRPYGYIVRGGGKKRQNQLTRDLRDLHVMGCDSRSKYIPRAYKEAPVSVRLAVLQGLMDTDGYTAGRRSRSDDPEKAGQVVASTVEFSSSSPALIADVKWLVRSLGGVSTTGTGQRVVNGTIHYRISFKLPVGFTPFRLERKATLYTPALKYKPRKAISGVELIGQKPMQCISVAHPDQLYVTNDFVVTHNTKTFIASAMKLRQLGLARKPLISVPMHLLDQVAREARQAYPTGKFLIATKEDLTRDNRRLFAARCATGDWDIVIMTHQALTSIPVSSQFEEEWLQEQKSALRWHLQNGDQQSNRGAKAVANAVRRLETRIASLRHNTGDADTVLFEQLGVDHISVDEVHMFRRLDVGASRNSGFSLGSSKRATDLKLKIESLASRHPGKPVFAGYTGTLWSNTLAETFVWQTFLQPQRLEEAEVGQFDAWAATFVRFETNVEVAPDGSGFRLHRRPSVIQNVPELRLMLAEVADLLTPEDIGLERPDATWTNVVSAPGEKQAAFVSELADRAEAIRGPGDAKRPDGTGDDNMLLVCNDGRRVALDPRLVGLTEASPKIEDAADRILASYHAGADTRFGTSELPGNLQLVLCDVGTPREDDQQTYGRLRARLIERGIPAGRVRFIHEAKTDKARAHLFAQCREGAVSVLIGSTEKVGVGTNIQTRLDTLHHLDAPWRPSDITQREGRGLRPGNHSEVVNIFRYVTERTFDAYMWQLLEGKQKFIAQMYVTDGAVREIADVSDTVLSFAEVKALASGNPALLRHAELSSEVRRLSVSRAVHAQRVNALKGHAKTARDRADTCTRRAERLRDAAAHFAGTEENASFHVTSLIDDLKDGRRSYAARWRGLELSIERGRYGADTKAADKTITITHKYGALGEIRVPRKVVRRKADFLEKFIKGEARTFAENMSAKAGSFIYEAAELTSQAAEAEQAAAVSVFARQDELTHAEAELAALEAQMEATAEAKTGEVALAA